MNLKNEDFEVMERDRYPNTFKGDKIINQNEDFIVYQRGGTNFFISLSLKAGGGRIEGILIKKASSKVKKFMN